MSKRSIRRKVVVGMSCIAAATSAACGEPDPSGPPAIAPIALDGVYASIDPVDLGLDEIELRGDRYRILANGCQDEDCEEQGSFELDVDAGVLRLVDERTGRAATLSIEVDEAFADPPIDLDPSNEEIRPQQLVKQSELVKRRVRLLRRAKIGKRLVERQAGGCSSAQIAQAQAHCRDVKCPALGGRSRGINYCSAGGGRASFSCACTGGGGGACGACQSKFRSCMDRASVVSCYRAADCRGEFFDCTDSLSACARPTIRGGCAGY